MPETACLHIQARDTDAIRVVELPGVSVRIGRAPYCEVRLTAPGLAEEECRLRRRGGTWHLVPIRLPGSVRLEGRSIEHPCPLPYDVPFRVGEHWMTLRSSRTAPPAWESYQAPSPVELPAPPALVPSEFGAEPRLEPAPAGVGAREPLRPDRPPPADAPERLARWQARQEQREDWLRSRQDDHGWQERWRAAGERLRMRAAAPAAPQPPIAPAPALSEIGPARRVESRSAADGKMRAGFPARSFARRAAMTPPSSLADRETAPTPHADLIREPLRSDRGTEPPLDEDRPSSAGTWFRPEPGPAVALEDPASPVHADGNGKSVDPPTAPTAPADSARPLRARKRPDSFGAWKVTTPPPRPEVKPKSFDRRVTALPPRAEARVDRSPTRPQPPEPPKATPVPRFSPLDPSGPRSDPRTVLDLRAPRRAETEARRAPLETPTAAEPVPQASPEPTPAAPTPTPSPSELVTAAPSQPDRDPPQVGEDQAPQTDLRHALHSAETGAQDGLEVERPTPPEEAVASPAVPVPETGLESEPVATAPRPAREDQSSFVTHTHVVEPSVWPEPAAPAELTTVQVEEKGEEIEARPRPPAGRTRRKSSRAAAVHARAKEQPAPAPSRPVRPERPAGTFAAQPEAPTTSREWPSARDIFAAHRMRPERESSARPNARAVVRLPVPTVAEAPAHWSLPLWLAWLPVTAAALTVGVAGLTLAWTWSCDAYAAGQVANRLARPEANAKPLPETVVLRGTGWWETTAGNLTHWATLRDRAADEPGRVEEVQSLLHAACQVAPLHAPARFTLSRPRPGGDAPGLLACAGLSRDVIALAWSGHQWLKAGKKETALKLYRAALEMASRTELSRLAAPEFNDDPQIRRYSLPFEALVGAVVRDMAAQDEWSYDEWSAALPKFAVAPLAAARTLRERGSPDVEKALDAILADADSPPPEDVPASVHLAAQAEALALRARWSEAEARYRQAIDQMADPTIRRSWWMNLADIALRLNDDVKRAEALEAARNTDPNDEITRRAVDLLKYSGVRLETPDARRRAETGE